MESKDTSRLYLNVDIRNPPDATATIPAKLVVDLTEDVVSCANDYDGSFIRVALPLSAVPYFTFQANYYYITLTYASTDYTAAVQFTSYDLASSTDLSIYFVQQFVDMVNACFSTLYSSVTSANPTAYNLFAGHAPYIAWNSQTSLMTLYTDVGAWETGAPNSPAIWFNTPLMQLFQNIPNKLASYNSTGHKDNQLVIVNRGTNLSTPAVRGFQIASISVQTVINTVYTSLTVTATTVNIPAGTSLSIFGSSANSNPAGGSDFFTTSFSQTDPVTSSATAAGATSININSWRCWQLDSVGWAVNANYPSLIATSDESPSVLDWWSTRRILVKSGGGMPARREGYPASSGTISAQNVLTDYIVSPGDRLAGSTIFIMVPQPEYRWFDFTSESRLAKIDLEFWAADNLGGSFLINLEPGMWTGTKLLLDRKGGTRLPLDSDKRRAITGSGMSLFKRQCVM